MPVSPNIAGAEIAIIEMTNDFRRANKLKSVSLNRTLSAAARRYAKFLAQSELFSHTADGRRPVDRVKAQGYGVCQIFENLALFLDPKGFQTRQLASRVVEGWKNSPGHRRNLIAPQVIDIGVGIFKARGAEKYIAVQLMGRPARLKYRFEIQNWSGGPIPFYFRGKRRVLQPSYSIRLTACLPDYIRFELPSQKAYQRYKAVDGKIFTIKHGSSGKWLSLHTTQDRHTIVIVRARASCC